MCDQCPPGTAVKRHCTADTPTECQACPEKHFAENWHWGDTCQYCTSVCMRPKVLHIIIFSSIGFFLLYMAFFWKSISFMHMFMSETTNPNSYHVRNHTKFHCPYTSTLLWFYLCHFVWCKFFLFFCCYSKIKCVLYDRVRCFTILDKICSIASVSAIS